MGARSSHSAAAVAVAAIVAASAAWQPTSSGAGKPCSFAGEWQTTVVWGKGTCKEDQRDELIIAKELALTVEGNKLGGLLGNADCREVPIKDGCRAALSCDHPPRINGHAWDVKLDLRLDGTTLRGTGRYNYRGEFPDETRSAGGKARCQHAFTLTAVRAK